MKYKCAVCRQLVYNDKEGMGEIKPGTKPEDFPDDWKCPICKSDKTHMIAQPIENFPKLYL